MSPNVGRSLLAALGIVVVAVAAGCGAAPASTVEPVTSASPRATATREPTARPTVAPTPEPSATPAGEPDLTSEPFTVLLLGLDHEGRTDAISVVGVDPVARTIAIASIPRDTIQVPLPGGGMHSDKINSFYNVARRDPARYPDGPGRAMADLVGGMLRIHIDYVAATTFGGFTAIVDAMGGVDITLPKAISDPAYQVTQTQIGIRFAAGLQTLDGKRALIYVRTRYSDNDFERQRRQQAFLLAAGRELLGNPALFVGLLAVKDNLQTDFPLDQVPGLLGTIASIDEWAIKQAVLGPTKYESAGSCTCGYALVPKLDEMRSLARVYYPWAVLP